MATDFSRTLSLLRQEMGISQRKAAAALGISQALLSHYENGIREPGLAFVARACDFYHVSADFLLGRTSSRDGSIIEAAELYDASDEKGTLKGSILATLQKKLVVNTAGVLFDLLGKCGDRTAITAAGDYLSTALKENVEKNPLKCEYFLPFVVDELLGEKKATVKVLKSMDKWYGVTARYTCGRWLRRSRCRS